MKSVNGYTIRLNAMSALARKLQNVGFALFFFSKTKNKKVLRPNKKGLRWSSFCDWWLLWQKHGQTDRVVDRHNMWLVDLTRSQPRVSTGSILPAAARYRLKRAPQGRGAHKPAPAARTKANSRHARERHRLIWCLSTECATPKLPGSVPQLAILILPLLLLLGQGRT
jgi:hypothetical protein